MTAKWTLFGHQGAIRLGSTPAGYRTATFRRLRLYASSSVPGLANLGRWDDIYSVKPNCLTGRQSGRIEDDALAVLQNSDNE